MPKFIAVRHGSNAANQSMIQRCVVAVVIAPDEEAFVLGPGPTEPSV